MKCPCIKWDQVVAPLLRNFVIINFIIYVLLHDPFQAMLNKGPTLQVHVSDVRHVCRLTTWVAGPSFLGNGMREIEG